MAKTHRYFLVTHKYEYKTKTTSLIRFMEINVNKVVEKFKSTTWRYMYTVIREREYMTDITYHQMYICAGDGKMIKGTDHYKEDLSPDFQYAPYDELEFVKIYGDCLYGIVHYCPVKTEYTEALYWNSDCDDVKDFYMGANMALKYLRGET